MNRILNLLSPHNSGEQLRSYVNGSMENETLPYT